MFLLQHLFLGALGAFSLLTPDLLNLFFLRFDDAPLNTLDTVQEDAAGQETIVRLRTRLLTLYGKSCRKVNNMDARRCLVDFLPSGT